MKEFDRDEFDSVKYTFWRDVFFFLIRNKLHSLICFLIPFKKCTAYVTTKNGIQRKHQLKILIELIIKK